MAKVLGIPLFMRVQRLEGKTWGNEEFYSFYIVTISHLSQIFYIIIILYLCHICMNEVMYSMAYAN